MPGLCFEEYTVGQVFRHPFRGTITDNSTIALPAMAA